jgi:S1-C subfamily serine protease
VKLQTAILLAVLLCSGIASAASHRTANFIVDAQTDEQAQVIASTAEKCRRELAIEWLGKAFPNWHQPCPIQANVSPNLGAGGTTSFEFGSGQVYGWRMTVSGSYERVLDSVIPHEVLHTVFATHFRRPLPRWADEGACSTIEHESERSKQQQMLVEFLHTNRGIAFSKMFAMREYPRDVMPLYAQGHSLAQFLLAHGGKRAFVAYIGDGLRDGDWQRATRTSYGFEDLKKLQDGWLSWVKAGSPNVDEPVAAEPAQVVSYRPEDVSEWQQSCVRLSVTDPEGQSHASGTVVDVRGGSALIVTCWHTFRESGTNAPVRVDVFYPRAAVLRGGRVLAFNQQSDTALVAIKLEGNEVYTAAGISSELPAVGQPAYSIGCGDAGAPEVWPTQITSINRYDGPANITSTSTPSQGRSGGGLFNERGQLVGVCQAGDGSDGLYAAVSEVLATADRAGLRYVFEKQTGQPVQVSETSGRRYWNGCRWVTVPNTQPIVRPVQPPAPLQPPPPKPDKPVIPVLPPEGKACERTGEGACKCDPAKQCQCGDLSKLACKCDGKDVADLKVYISKLETRIGELEKRPACKPCECNSEEEPATRPGQPALFDIKPRVRK